MEIDKSKWLYRYKCTDEGCGVFSYMKQQDKEAIDRHAYCVACGEPAMADVDDEGMYGESLL